MQKQITIFVVQKDHDTRAIIRQCLEPEGYFVVSVPESSVALSMLKEMTPPALIVMEIESVHFKSEEFLKILKSDPELKIIPVLQFSFEKQSQLKGTCGAVSWPANVATFLTAVKDCLKGH